MGAVRTARIDSNFFKSSRSFPETETEDDSSRTDRNGGGIRPGDLQRNQGRDREPDSDCGREAGLRLLRCRLRLPGLRLRRPVADVGVLPVLRWHHLLLGQASQQLISRTAGTKQVSAVRHKTKPRRLISSRHPLLLRPKSDRLDPQLTTPVEFISKSEQQS